MALAIDASTPGVPANDGSASSLASITTASFTPPDGSLLVVMLQNGVGTAGFNVAPTNTGGTVAWDGAVKISEAANATAGAIWLGKVTTGASMTVSATLASAQAGWGIFVVVVTGQAATQNGATGVGTSTFATATASLTTTAANSLVLGSNGVHQTGTAPTAGSGQSTTFNGTLFDWNAVTTGSGWGQYLTGMNLGSGATATINDTAPGGLEFSLAICEILAAPPTPSPDAAIVPPRFLPLSAGPQAVGPTFFARQPLPGIPSVVPTSVQFIAPNPYVINQAPGRASYY